MVFIAKQRSARRVISRLKFSSALLVASSLMIVTGCQQGGTNWSTPKATIALQGVVLGGQQPVTGSSIQLYAAGRGGVASSAEPLLAKASTSDGHGRFSLSGAYTCPTPTSKIYVVAEGGNPGLTAGSENKAITLMAMLGPCEDIASSPFVTINEVTTVGSISPISPYMHSVSRLGASSADSSFPAAVKRVGQLIDLSHGASPGLNLPEDAIVPSTKLNTLADVLAACVSSAGGVAGDGSVCGALFTLATPQHGTAPTETATAALNIAQNPTVNVAELYALTQPATAPFQPTLPNAPHDWALSLVSAPAAPTFSPAGGTYAAGQAITIATAASGGAIHYTADGSTPTSASPTYGAPLLLSASETIHAITVVGELSSGTSVASYTTAKAHLIFSTQPTGTATGIPLNPIPTVQVVDGSGKLLPNTTPVTIALLSNTGAASLGGVTTVTAVKGAASFPGLSVSAVGLGYTLSAAAAGMDSIASSPFNVIAPGLAMTISTGTVGRGATGTGSVLLPAPAAADTAVLLASSMPNYVSISPATVVIPQGMTSATYTFTGVGPGISSLNASATGYTPVHRNVGGQPAAPTFLLAPGAYASGQAVGLSSADRGAVIHYTTDGSVPSVGSPAYNRPLVLTSAETVRAYVDMNYVTSPVSSASYTVEPPHLVFATQPASTTLGLPLSPTPTVQIVDGSGNLVQGNTPVTLALASNPGGAMVNGTTTGIAINGVATFPGLTLSAAGVGYTLKATSPSVTEALSGVFDVRVPSLVMVVSSGVVGVGRTVSGSIQLAQPAKGAFAVMLSSSVAGTVFAGPAVVLFGPGQSVSSFTVTGLASGTVTLTGTAAGYSVGSAVVSVLPAPAAVRTYFVANGGRDGNDGATAATAWQTLGKLNAAKVPAGSAVYLQCGSVFRESLALSGAGTASAPVFYGAYGACTGANLPQVTGADVVSGWTAEPEGSFTAYYAALATAPAMVFEDNHRLALGTAKSGLGVGTSFYDAANGRLYVRSREDGAPGGHVVEASVRSYPVSGYRTNYLTVAGIESDKAGIHDISIAGSLTNVILSGLVTNSARGNGVYFTANTGESQNNVLIVGGVANGNGGDGVSKGNGGTNVVVSGYTANYNGFDPLNTFSGGIRLVSDGSTDANRATYSGVVNSVTDFNGVNPETKASVATSTGSGVGVWCDTCGNGSFLVGNEGHGNTQAGAELEWAGTIGSQAMVGNREWNNFYGVLHTRRSHNALVANNTAWGNFINCAFGGEYGGGETKVGMVNNTYANNICSSRVGNGSGTALSARWGAENNTLGEGSGNVYVNNSFGVPGTANGNWAEFGSRHLVKTYAALEAMYGSSMQSMQLDPMLANPGAGDLSLMPGSPAVGAGVGGADLGAVPHLQP